MHENIFFSKKKFSFRPPPDLTISGGSPLGKKFQKKIFSKVVPNHLKRREKTSKFFKKKFSDRPGEVENQNFFEKKNVFRAFGYLMDLKHFRPSDFFGYPCSL